MSVFTYIVVFASIIVAMVLSELITKYIIKTNKKWIVRVLIFFIISIIVLIKTWGFWATPIENPQVDLFEEYYVGDDFVVLKRIEIDPDMYYIMIGYSFGTKHDQCIVGEYDRYNYMFYYKKKYYDIVEFNLFRKISCDELTEMNLPGLYD